MTSLNDMSDQQVKDFIKSIITSNPMVSTIHSIQKDYKEMIGSPIPFLKFGFNSVEHFLKNIPDTCVVHGTGYNAQVTLIPSKKSAHINEMVVQQKVNIKGRRHCLPPRRRKTMPFPVPLLRQPFSWHPSPQNYALSPNSSVSSCSSRSYSSPESYMKISNNNIQTRTTCTNQNSNMGQKNTNMGNTNTNGQSFLRRKTENTDEKRNYILEQNKLENRKVKEHLESLIQHQVKMENINKTSTTSPPQNQQTETLHNSINVNIPDNGPILDNLSNLNVKECDGTEEYVKKDCFSSTSNILFDKSKEKLNHLLSGYKSVDEEIEDTSNVPNRVQCNLKTLISQFRDGIWCNDVPEHYKRLFKKDLMYMEYGYTSLIDMCLALKHIFHYVRPSTDDFKLYDRSKPLPESVEKVYTMASFDLGKKVKSGELEGFPDLDWSDYKQFIPEDIFKFGNNIPNEFVPEGTKVESIMDVVVVEAYDPSKFWFYLGTSDNSTPLDKLMDQMQTFYNDAENAKNYALPSFLLREGLYCVQIVYGEYHRARILRVLPDCPDYVRVLYIDYGTLCKAPVKGMRFLHAKFGELNAQAIRCRLANIVPTLKGHPWPRTTSDRFRELVNRRDTKIKISYIDWNEEYVCVFLADVTNPDKVVYINETLVKEGHAVWEGETQIRPFVLSNFNCKVQNIHLFPTFLELEYGLAPTASEMYSLEDLFVPLHLCLPQYFERTNQVTYNDDDEIEQIENSFIETVKNHRKFTSLSKVDVTTVINPPPIDFDVFGDLKDEMMEFYKSMNLEVDKQGQVNEEELYCDIDEAAENNLEHFKVLEKSLEEFEPVRLMKQDKELSKGIIEKLEKYTLLDSETSSGFERGGLHSDESRIMAAACTSETLDLDELLASEELVEHELSTIFEQSDASTPEDSAPQTPNAFFGFRCNIARSRLDVNIFDNPEEFDRSSESSGKSESERPVSAESFLRTVERICFEETEVLETSNSATENSSVVCTDSENPFKFDIAADLKEAFNTFLEAKKDRPDGSGCERGPNTSNRGESPAYRETDRNDCEESFLKNMKIREVKADDSVEQTSDSGRNEIVGVRIDFVCTILRGYIDQFSDPPVRTGGSNKS